MTDDDEFITVVDRDRVTFAPIDYAGDRGGRR